MSEGAVGLDLRAAIEIPLTLSSLERSLVPTGIAIAIPSGYEAQIRPRSGLALKRGLSLINTPGTIDSDYRGEIQIPLINLSPNRVLIEPGERIAQMIFSPIIKISWVEVKELGTTTRGTGGFGHTGNH